MRDGVEYMLTNKPGNSSMIQDNNLSYKESCVLLEMSLFENGQHTLPSGIRADVGLWKLHVKMKGSNLS